MSHVDEGRLHAWLDYGRSGMSEAEYKEIGDHLKRCAECSALLAEERALRDRSAALLGATGPRASSPPSFEELKARARADGRLPESAVPPHKPIEPEEGRDWSGRRSRRQLVGLAWAASLMAALGLGWIASTLMEGDQLAIQTVESPAARESAPESLEMAAPAADDQVAGKMAAPTETATVAPPASSEAVAVPEAMPAADSPPPSSGAPTALTSPSAARQVAPAPSAEAPRPVTAGEIVVAGFGAREDAESAGIAADQGEPIALRAAGVPAGVAPPPAAPSAAPAALGFAGEPAPAWEAVSPERAAERLGSGILTHPAFPVLRIEVPTAEGVRMARVVHILPGDGTLTITQSRTSGGEAAFVTPSESATIMRDDVVITGTGPISADSISTLLEGLR